MPAFGTITCSTPLGKAHRLSLTFTFRPEPRLCWTFLPAHARLMPSDIPCEDPSPCGMLSLNLSLTMTLQVLERDVAYELIPFSQRRSMHAKLAAALEDVRGAAAAAEGSPPVPATAVAYHWEQSCASVEVAEWRRALKARLCGHGRNTCAGSDDRVLRLQCMAARH